MADDAALTGLSRVATLDADALSAPPRSGVFLRDGGVAVVDYAGQQILVWDSGGHPRAPIGRRGSGPGEFRQLVWVAAIGDSVLGFDFGLRRFSLFDRNGAVLGTFSSPELDPGGWPGPLGTLTGGNVLLLGNTMPRPGARQAGVVDDSSFLYVVNVRQGKFDRRWGPVPTVRYRVATGAGVTQGMSIVATFDPRTSIAVVGGRVAMATGSDSVIVMFDSTGRRTGVLHAPLQGQRVPPEDVVAARSEDGGRDRAFRAAREAILRDVNPPAQSPVITEVVGAGPERLFVRGWTSSSAVTAWWVRMTTNDSVLGTFSLPRTARVLAARGDLLLVGNERQDGSVSLAIYRVHD